MASPSARVEAPSGSDGAQPPVASTLRGGAVGLVGLVTLGAVMMSPAIALDVYLIWRSFFHQLWGAGFRMGQSIVVVGCGVALACAVYAAWISRRRSRGREPDAAASGAAAPAARTLPRTDG